MKFTPDIVELRVRWLRARAERLRAKVHKLSLQLAECERELAWWEGRPTN